MIDRQRLLGTVVVGLGRHAAEDFDKFAESRITRLGPCGAYRKKPLQGVLRDSFKYLRKYGCR